MTDSLEGLEPKEIWKHFDAIAKIPRASTKEAAVIDYVLSQAGHGGYEVMQDKVGNLVVRKPAHRGREAAPMVMLQAHLDMVCEKDEMTVHNFDTDPIQIVRNGDWLKANGTTLGADNGVGIAAALAVMASKDLAHGPLEFVFTVDEETGLTGATEFSAGMLKSKYYLNLDTEETDTICIGCAGGVKTIGRRHIELRKAKAVQAWRVKVSGLRGGHSGVDIHQGRGNALRILGGVLQSVLREHRAEISEVNGGSAQNAIPREAFAIVLLDARRETELRSLVAKSEQEYKADLGTFDEGLRITVEPVSRPAKVMKATDGRVVVDLLASLPHGVLAMSPDVRGLTQNSTNLATVSTEGETVEIVTSQRSAIESSKWAAANMVATIFRLAEFGVEQSGSYPGWKPEPNSDVVVKLQATHEKLFGHPAKLIAMHAGLECGVIGEKYPGMQMASFGPTIVDPHSPNERVQISTVEAFWKYLKAGVSVRLRHGF